MVVVEVACLVDRNGVQPCHFGALPEQLAALNRGHMAIHKSMRKIFSGPQHHGSCLGCSQEVVNAGGPSQGNPPGAHACRG